LLVISGVLVLVALVLLIVGIVNSGLVLVYMCIGVAIVAFVCLGVSVLQTRGSAPKALRFLVRKQHDEQPSTAPSSSDGADDKPRAEVRAPQREQANAETSDPPTETEPAAVTAAARASGGDVMVVEGRPRYHLEGCRYLSGRSGQTKAVEAARQEGFSPCGVCKPDESLVSCAGSPLKKSAE